MTSSELKNRLTSGRLSKEKITVLVEELQDQPKLVKVILDVIWFEDKEGTFNASWVFDHLMRKKLDYLLPFITDFSQGLEGLQSESCIRPMAHVCELIAIARYKNKDIKYINGISSQNLEQIVSACFDWLIGSRKVAAKVFAMTSLRYLGAEFKWIHPELKPILENSINSGTAGYKFRAKKTLEELKKLE
ncbi:hypothetical protein [uncultured Croceitalea sp.]|uniref:hypothetical protein n=1 Tax=uncultured Croceitalea sp. TaxID=1798908 RepID=UPI00374E4129